MHPGALHWRRKDELLELLEFLEMLILLVFLKDALGPGMLGMLGVYGSERYRGYIFTGAGRGSTGSTGSTGYWMDMVSESVCSSRALDMDDDGDGEEGGTEWAGDRRTICQWRRCCD